MHSIDSLLATFPCITGCPLCTCQMQDLKSRNGNVLEQSVFHIHQTNTRNLQNDRTHGCRCVECILTAVDERQDDENNKCTKLSAMLWHQCDLFLQEKGNFFTLLILKSLFVSNSTLHSLLPSNNSCDGAPPVTTEIINARKSTIIDCFIEDTLNVRIQDDQPY